MQYPQPKMNQKSPKGPKSILILTMKLLYTYFWKTLPIGALIWLALIWLKSCNPPQIAQKVEIGPHKWSFHPLTRTWILP